MTKEIIEIKGVRFEVDLETAKKVEEYRVGDIVKVLKKEYSDYKSYAGTIVGFDAFKERPTIIIAYVNPGSGYSSADVQFIYYNQDTADVEICLANENDLCFCKESIVDSMEKEIRKKKAEAAELEQKKEFFIKNFNRCFEDKSL